MKLKSSIINGILHFPNSIEVDTYVNVYMSGLFGNDLDTDPGSESHISTSDSLPYMDTYTKEGTLEISTIY